MQEHVYNFALNALDLGHTVRVITSNIKVLSDDPHFSDRVPVERLGVGVPIHQNGSVARITIAPRLGKRLEEILARERFDVLHIHSPLTPTLPILSLTRSTTTTVGTFHTNFNGSPFFTVFNAMCQKYLERLDGLIAVSKTAIGALDRYFKAEYRIIPNGIDLSLFRPDIGRLPEFDDGRFNLLWVGRMEPRNGLDRMIKAFSLACASRDDLRLIAVGDGPLRATYESMVPSRLKPIVHFTGFVNSGRPAIYSSCDALCVPATISSFGITLLEGMAAAKPIIASNIDGFSDVMTADVEGLFVDTSEPAAFRDAILRLASDRELSSKLGLAGLKTAQRYAWRNVTCEILDYYRVAMERHKLRHAN
ncbi:MAG: glycosyltransferase family 4 protein [Myxococcota bacterium]